jgi:hypothetical protein
MISEGIAEVDMFEPSGSSHELPIGLGLANFRIVFR